MKKTNKTQFRKYLNKFGAYRNHWVTAFNILKFDKNLSIEENYKAFSKWIFSINWRDVKKHLFLRDYEVLQDLKIKKIVIRRRYI